MRQLQPLNYYEILGLEKGSSTSDIKKQYERMKRIYGQQHPLMRHLFDVEEMFLFNSLLDSVYDVLIDPDKRREYDMEMEGTADSLKLSFPESFDIRQLLKRYHKQKKADPKFVKKDMFGRAVENEKDSMVEVEAQEMNQLFEKLGDVPVNGEFLRKIREEAGLSIKTISEATKISHFVVRAMEDDNYSKLPSVVYVRGFLKLYCRALKLSDENSERVVDDYIALMKGEKRIVLDDEE